MKTAIGARLAALRRQKGLTQEQLAAQLGVSAPAVSKWETDHSYPDITLLCPLARALGVTVDTLLQFEPDLSDRDIAEKVNAVLSAAQTDGCKAGEQMISALLHQYPSSAALKFNIAAAYDAFQMFFPAVDPETRARWTARKAALLADVRASGEGLFCQTATLQLAGLALAENRLRDAEQLLGELPEHIVDPTLPRSNLYLKKGEPEEALKTVQRRLFILVRQALACLGALLNPDLLPDDDQALKICTAYRTIDELFGCGGFYEGLFLEVYLRMNRPEEAAACLERYVDALTGPAALPKRAFFSPGLEIKEKQPASSQELRRLLLKGLEEEPQYQALRQYPSCRRAVEKLKAGLLP